MNIAIKKKPSIRESIDSIGNVASQYIRGARLDPEDRAYHHSALPPMQATVENNEQEHRADREEYLVMLYREHHFGLIELFSSIIILGVQKAGNVEQCHGGVQIIERLYPSGHSFALEPTFLLIQ